MNYKLTTLFFAEVIALALVLPVAASPLSAPCIAGATYNSECDVDHNGVINVLDIQLAAGHWNQSGSYPVDAYWTLIGNAGTAPATSYIGTVDNQPLQLRVNNSRALLIQPSSNGSHNLIGGYSGNAMTTGVYGGTIGGGGGPSGTANQVTDNFGTVSGGRQNVAGNNDANVENQDFATVSGGSGNTASMSGATVGGGVINNATGGDATVAGGFNNTASGVEAMVGGGSDNTAAGATSFAAGHRAKALNNGTFVWADSQEDDFSSTTYDTFNVRARNGTLLLGNNANFGAVIKNEGIGDGLRAITYSSQGTSWAAVYAAGLGTSPGLYASSFGTYSAYFASRISVVGGCTGCTLMYIAVNTGDKALQPGELVAANGVGETLAGSTDPVLRVSQSGADATGVVGVVYSRVNVTSSERDGEVLADVQKADGAVQPGEYLLIVVQGLAQVRLADNESVVPGQRLKASDIAGQARALRTVEVNGVTLDEGGAVVGTLLDAPDTATGLAPVMVTLR